jgi:alanyl aminopeptidase
VPRIVRALTLLLPCVLAAAAPEGPSLRLDNIVVPTHYAAQLTIAPNSDTFEGSVDIGVTVSAPQPVIWLNALDLDLKTVTSGDRQAKVIPGHKGFVGLEFPQPLPAGSARIHIDYTGKISRKSSAGVFQLEDNHHWYVYTQFESTDARRAFPCFDQPSFKAPWDIALRVPAAGKAFANTPEISSSPQADGRPLRYDRSRKGG